MGTLTIEQYPYKGGLGERDAQVPTLKGMTRTVDTSTSTTAESITLEKSTSIIRVVAASADHRISIGNNVADNGNYATVGTTQLDFGVDGGDTLYYRLDA